MSNDSWIMNGNHSAIRRGDRSIAIGSNIVIDGDDLIVVGDNLQVRRLPCGTVVVILAKDWS